MAEERIQPQSNEKAVNPPSLESLLSDPAMLAKLSGILSALGEKAPPPAPEPPAESPKSPDLLGALLSNPAMLEKLPQILAVLKPLLSADATAEKHSIEPSTPTAVVLHDPVIERNNLLCALKPFLSKERQDAVESILRITKLGEFLKQMK